MSALVADGEGGSVNRCHDLITRRNKRVLHRDVYDDKTL